MIKSILSRSIHQSISASMLFYCLIVIIHFTSAYLHSLYLFSIGMLLYPLISLLFVKKGMWNEIRIKKPGQRKGILFWCIISVLYVFASFFFLYFIIGKNYSNFTYIMADQQTRYGVVTAQNAWFYFPIAAIGVLTGPFTENFFFRGVISKAFEKRYSLVKSNIIQGFLFALVHYAYLSLNGFKPMILFTMIPIVWIAAILYGHVAQKFDSIWFAILVHGIYDICIMTLTYAFLIAS